MSKPKFKKGDIIHPIRDKYYLHRVLKYNNYSYYIEELNGSAEWYSRQSIEETSELAVNYMKNLEFNLDLKDLINEE